MKINKTDTKRQYSFALYARASDGDIAPIVVVTSAYNEEHAAAAFSTTSTKQI